MPWLYRDESGRAPLVGVGTLLRCTTFPAAEIGHDDSKS